MNLHVYIHLNLYFQNVNASSKFILKKEVGDVQVLYLISFEIYVTINQIDISTL